MKNICFFNSTKFWGGGENFHLETAIEFQKINYNIFLLSKLDSPLWNKAKHNNLKTYPITVSNLSFLNPFKIAKLVFFFKSRKIDTVIFTTSHDMKLGSISAYIAGVKRIAYSRGLDVPVKASLLNRIIYKHFLTHLTPNSINTKNSMLKNFGNTINENKVRHIYRGVDLEKISNDKTGKLTTIQKKGHGIILGNAGRLTKQKGQDKLIHIAKKLRDKDIDFTLFIAGKGELENELEKLIEKNDLRDKVIMLGFVDDMQKFMNSIDIFLLTSAWEGFGFVLVEAMIKSKPVVAFDITSNPEIVENNKSGFLVEHPDLDSFTQKTIALIKDENLRKEMGNVGLKNVMRKFNVKDRVVEIEKFLETTP